MKTLSAIESFTGGLFAATIISNKGASKFFKGSLVAYDKTIKQKIGIDISDGTISQKTVLSMTKMGRKYFNSDICVAFTGNAGPNYIENKQKGYVFIAINNDVYECYFEGNCNEIRKKAVDFALQKLNWKW